jgi:hypothetical protein
MAASGIVDIAMRRRVFIVATLVCYRTGRAAPRL